MKDIWTNFYQIIYETDPVLYDRFKLVFIAKDLTHIFLVGGLACMIVIPVYFIPRISRLIHQEFSDVTEHMLQWFLIFLSAASMLCVVTLVYYFTLRFPVLMELFWGAGFFFIGYLMYHKLVFKRSDDILPEVMSTGSISMAVQLTRYFDESKPWLNPDLKMGHVATFLGTNRTYLSAILNDELNTNFKSFVNSYRVAEAKRLLEKKDGSIKLQEVAFESGFNCYTTFFCAFRKEMGVPPHQYVAGVKTG